MLGRVDGDQHVRGLQRDGVAFEEVGQVDEPFAALGVGVGDEFVVGEREAEDVRIDYYDAAGVGAVADYVGV